jgi:uncharacterized protein YkwD
MKSRRKRFPKAKVIPMNKLRILSWVLAMLWLAPVMPAQTTSSSVDSFDDAAAQKFTATVNAERKKAGLSPLEVNSHLNDSAKLHVLEVAKHNEASDQFPEEMNLNQRIGATEFGIAAAAENIGINSDIDAAIERLSSNPVTSANMLNPKYTDVGAAVLKHDGRYYVVENMVEALAKIDINELEKIVVAAVQKERVQHKIAPLKVVAASRLRTVACEMAEKKQLKITEVDPSTLGVGGGFISKTTTTRMVSFTLIQPNDLPAELTKLTGEPTVTNFSVGACKSDSEYYISTVFYYDVRHELR